jgi:exonuclease III
MNGFTAPASAMSGIEKWSTIIRTMNKRKIAILAIQETHLDDSRLADVLSVYGHKVTIIASQLPDTPRASAGVALVLNKKFIDPKELIAHELHKGRALFLRIKWHDPERKDLVLLNIYAPNNRAEQKVFWRNINAKRIMLHLRRPDFMLGDFNVTEDNIDRAPAHPDEPNAITALREIRQQWELHDAWRHAHPNERCFTYRAMANGQQIQARLDRIYISRGTSQHTFEWHITPTATPTDHWMAIVKYAPGDTPHIGRGRWTWPITSLQNDKLMSKIVTRGTQLQSDIENLKRDTVDRNVSNPQLLWRDFKSDISKTAKLLTKESHLRVNSRINALTKDLKEIAANPNLDTDDSLRTSEAMLANELTHLERINARKQKEILHARIADHGERLGGIWSAMSKDSKPRDLIKRLKIPNSNPPQYERRSDRMARLARDYHENLQHDDLPVQEDLEAYDHGLNKISSAVPNNQRLEEPTGHLKKMILQHSAMSSTLLDLQILRPPFNIVQCSCH